MSLKWKDDGKNTTNLFGKDVALQSKNEYQQLVLVRTVAPTLRVELTYLAFFIFFRTISLGLIRDNS